MKDLEQIGVDQKDRRLLETLYWEQVAAVSIDGDLSEWINIKRGVRQGCVLSPDLFSLYTELIMRKVMEGKFKVNGHTISDIRYADDTVLISDDEQNLQEMIVSLKNESEVRGLNINKQKTKLMVFSKSRNVPTCNIYLDNEKIKQVQEFEYLGSIITSDVKCDKDIKRRIAIAKKKFIEKKSILTNSKVSIETRKRFLKCYIWSVLLYGSESWTISAEMKRKMEAMEMWCYRRMLKISWTEFVSNEKVLGQDKEEQQILVSITQRQLKFFGHIVRENNLERLVLEGKIDGSRSRGRQKEVLRSPGGCGRMLVERRTLPSGSRQKEIQMHGRQRHLTWHNKKKNLRVFTKTVYQVFPVLISLMKLLSLTGFILYLENLENRPFLQKVRENLE